ncbi:trypsin-like peptidase domain-containing protein [Phototrophicus methaneseepsis]|uniref:Trypsin-like peptidase domain-containing protein n=1 Tax=Phototrophicus methaneseepsis TaxID=2710758 RepID=A0A7S8EA96_9CHLR|nr:serine protease [Phototrophicus methaneseepsis]QPC83225.1 trypsin-like peptidase domain-containing protein [Phototrophicus methaneseepsis]
MASAQMEGDAIDEIAKSVVQIVALQGGEPVWVGSGTIVTRDGLIFTNRHVVEGADDFIISMLDDPNELPVPSYYASIETMFPLDYGEFQLDFATLQIDRDIDGNAIFRTRLDLPFLDTTKFAEARRGDEVYVFGYPTIGDGYFVFTNGLISSIQNATVGSTRMPVFYQTNAEIAPGNSGGLATNGEGELLGIPTSVRSEDRTAARLSGIIPYSVVEAAVENRLVQPDTGPTIDNPDAPETTSSDAGMSIEITNVEWDAEFNGEAVVAIHMQVQAIGYLGTDLQVGVFFYYDDTDELTDVPAQLEDFMTPSGGLSAQDVITATYDNTIWDDLIFYVPLTAFPVESADRTAVMVGAIGVDNVGFDVISESWPYSVSAGTDTTTKSDSSGGAYEGVDVICPDGTTIQDGVEITVIQMRPGFEYTATVIGLGDYDPVLAVTPTLDGEGAYQAELCSDDDSVAAGYSVSLPTTGNVSASSRSARVRFSHSDSDFLNVSFIVGEYDRLPGEFVLVLEGMAATSADGIGDPFLLTATPNVLASPIPATLYMIGAESQLDPLMYLLNTDTMEPFETSAGQVICDDAGGDTCWGTSYAFGGGTVSRAGNRTYTADEYDPMISIPMNTPDATDPLAFTYVMTSYNQESSGQYIMVFHIGTE